MAASARATGTIYIRVEVTYPALVFQLKILFLLTLGAKLRKKSKIRLPRTSIICLTATNSFVASVDVRLWKQYIAGADALGRLESIVYCSCVSVYIFGSDVSCS